MEEGRAMSDQDDIRRDFGQAVNMTPGELSRWPVGVICG